MVLFDRINPKLPVLDNVVSRHNILFGKLNSDPQLDALVICIFQYILISDP